MEEISGHQVTCMFCLMEGKKEEIFCKSPVDVVLSFMLHLKDKHSNVYEIIVSAVKCDFDRSKADKILLDYINDPKW